MRFVGILLLLALAASGHARTVDSVFDDALRAVALTRDDLRFRTDYADQADSFRVAVVDSLLSRPLATERYVVTLADRMSAAATLEEMVEIAGGELDLAVSAPAADGEDVAVPVTALDIARIVLVPALLAARAETEAAFSRLSLDDRVFLETHAPVLLDEEEFDPDKPIDQREREAEEEEALGDELLVLAGDVDYEHLARAGAVVARAVDAAVDLIEGGAAGEPDDSEPPAGFSGDIVAVAATDAGAIVVGGTGPTVHGGAASIIIDLGGDDIYRSPETGTHSVVIDVEGDDVYLGRDHAFGAGFAGVGVLADLEGDDQYSAGSFSLGSGLFGVGILHDAAGNDRYVGDTCVEGAGAFGLGLLIDDAGNDSYHAAVFSQAFGFVMGLGAIRDGCGNDHYFAGGKYTDEIRYFDHYISLSQGFGFGWRPDASGGIGLLVDDAGNDVYVSDIFGQGSSYWFSVGGLVDRSGNDNYVSYQYAQGAATHITVAALVDSAGDDNYVSQGVSQGCGHDLAIGVLHDVGGDDNYACHGLSQGAGNANGIGVLIDDAGDDSYSVRDPDNTLGYGDRRRDYSSIGVFIDAGGEDSYGVRGADGTWWIGSRCGVGVDTEIEGETE